MMKMEIVAKAKWDQALKIFQVWQGLLSPIPLCDACKKSDFDENDDLTVCKAYGKIPKKYLNAKDYNCPHFDNENNGWYQLIKDKVERQQKKEK